MPMQGEIVLGGLGQFGSCSLRCAICRPCLGRAARLRVKSVAFVNLHLAIVADLDEGFAALLQGGLVILPRRKARALVEHGHLPALGRKVVSQACNGAILQGPECGDIGKVAGIAEQVGHDVALVGLNRKQRSARCDLLAPEQPLLQLVPLGAPSASPSGPFSASNAATQFFCWLRVAVASSCNSSASISPFR